MEKEIATTSNGHEIRRPTEQLDAEEYVGLLEKFGINGASPAERLEQLKSLSAERIAVLISSINKGLQGSKDHLLRKDRAMKIGEQDTIAPEDRYDVFVALIDDIKNTPDTINPERVADTLAMGIVLLHPFYDGNGRTARVVGLTFREGFDDPDSYAQDFEVVTEPRDLARARGGFLIYSYTPQFPDDFDRSDPTQVSHYLHDLITTEAEGAYIGPFGQAPLEMQPASLAA